MTQHDSHLRVGGGGAARALADLEQCPGIRTRGPLHACVLELSGPAALVVDAATVVPLPRETPFLLWGGGSPVLDRTAVTYVSFVRVPFDGQIYVCAQQDWKAVREANEVAELLWHPDRYDIRLPRPRIIELLEQITTGGGGGGGGGTPTGGVTGYLFALQEFTASLTPPELYGVYADPILPDLASALTLRSPGPTPGRQGIQSFAGVDVGGSANRLASIGITVLAIDTYGYAWYTPISNTTPGTRVAFPDLDPGAEVRCLGVNSSEDGTTWWALVEYAQQTWDTDGVGGYLPTCTSRAVYALKSTATTPIHAGDWSVAYTVLPPSDPRIPTHAGLFSAPFAGGSGTIDPTLLYNVEQYAHYGPTSLAPYPGYQVAWTGNFLSDFYISPSAATGVGKSDGSALYPGFASGWYTLDTVDPSVTPLYRFYAHLDSTLDRTQGTDGILIYTIQNTTMAQVTAGTPVFMDFNTYFNNIILSQTFGIGGNGATLTRNGDDSTKSGIWTYRNGSGLSVDYTLLDIAFLENANLAASGGPGPSTIDLRMRFDQDGSCWATGQDGYTFFLFNGGPLIDPAGALDQGIYVPTNPRYTAVSATGDGAGGGWAMNYLSGSLSGGFPQGRGALWRRPGPFGTAWVDTGITVWSDTRTLYDMSRSGKYLDWLLSVPSHPTQLQLYQGDTSTYVPPIIVGSSGSPVSGNASGCPTATANDGVRSDDTFILSFTCDVTNPDLGMTVTLTATTNQDILVTYWDLIIYDDLGNNLQDVGSGATAVYNVSYAAATSYTYHAELRWYENESFGPASATGTITVNWATGGYNPGRTVPGSMTITAYPAIDLTADGVAAISSYAVYGTPTVPTTGCGLSTDVYYYMGAGGVLGGPPQVGGRNWWDAAFDASSWHPLRLPGWSPTAGGNTPATVADGSSPAEWPWCQFHLADDEVAVRLRRTATTTAYDAEASAFDSGPYGVSAGTSYTSLLAIVTTDPNTQIVGDPGFKEAWIDGDRLGVFACNWPGAPATTLMCAGEADRTGAGSISPALALHVRNAAGPTEAYVSATVLPYVQFNGQPTAGNPTGMNVVDGLNAVQNTTAVSLFANLTSDPHWLMKPGGGGLAWVLTTPAYPARFAALATLEVRYLAASVAGVSHLAINGVDVGAGLFGGVTQDDGAGNQVVRWTWNSNGESPAMTAALHGDGTPNVLAFTFTPHANSYGITGSPIYVVLDLWC